MRDRIGYAPLMRAVDAAASASLAVDPTVVFDFLPRERIESLLLGAEFDTSEPEHVYIS